MPKGSGGFGASTGPPGVVDFQIFRVSASCFFAGMMSSCHFLGLSVGVQLLSPSPAFHVESSLPFRLHAANLAWNSPRMSALICQIDIEARFKLATTQTKRSFRKPPGGFRGLAAKPLQSTKNWPKLRKGRERGKETRSWSICEKNLLARGRGELGSRAAYLQTWRTPRWIPFGRLRSRIAASFCAPRS